MWSARAVARGTPDPDGDRRFDERPFPLLEPLEWTGERHRGGYGTQDPGGNTIALGLIFGPWDPFTRERRLAVTVARELPIMVTDDSAALLLRTVFVTDRWQLRRPDMWPRPVRAKATVEIERTGVQLDVLRTADRWLGHGVWRDFVVEIDAVAMEPGEVRLRVAANIPSR